MFVGGTDSLLGGVNEFNSNVSTGDLSNCSLFESFNHCMIFQNKTETIDVRQGRLSIHDLNKCQNNVRISIGLVFFLSFLYVDYGIRGWTRNNLTFINKKFFYIVSVIDSGCVSVEPKIFKYHCLNIRKIEPNISV